LHADGKLGTVNQKEKIDQKGRDLGHVTYFSNFGTP